MAAVLSGAIAYFFNKRMRLSATQHALIRIVAANSDLPSGVTLGNKDITTIEWPSALPLPGSFTKVEDVVGRPLIYPLGAKEPVLKRDLGVVGSGIGLSAKIPAGMRATAVRSNEIVGVAGFLYPGSHLDVLVTYTPPGTSSGPMTQTVLQDVVVLTAGQTIEPDPQGKPQEVNVVTLLLSPEDSQKLQLASQQGTIQFVLRSGVDQQNVNIRPTRLDQLAGLEKPPTPVAKRLPGRPKPSGPPPPVYVLEVIQGTQRSVQKF